MSHFEIFDCKGAFDVILGKPWLREVRAQHDYVMDSITIGKDGQQETIANILNTPSEDTNDKPETPPRRTTDSRMDPDLANECIKGNSPRRMLARDYGRGRKHPKQPNPEAATFGDQNQTIKEPLGHLT